MTQADGREGQEINKSPAFSYEEPFDLRLAQVVPGGDEPSSKIIGSLFISFDTIQKISRRERVLVWNLPLAALQRKIGEAGRFCLPDHSIIDDIFAFTLNEYRQTWPTHLGNGHVNQSRPSLTLFWTKSTTALQASDKGDESVSTEASADDEKVRRQPIAPMKEKDWDYVFQANKILHCSFVSIEDKTVARAPHAAFRLRDSNEDDAEPDLPQDDEKAKIPVWSLSQEPSHTYLQETNSELETSATTSGHSKKSWEIGLSGAYKIISGDAKYGRSMEKSTEDSSTYGTKQSTMLTIHEIPIIELSLNEGNCRISHACRQALLKLRADRCFDDLMGFFRKYGTIYAKKVVLGGRLINSQRFYEETMQESTNRQTTAKKYASASLGIEPFSIKGSFSDEFSKKDEKAKSEKKDEKNIDWTGYGGNAALVSIPEQWLPTVAEYRYWQVTKNLDVESIQDFIGRLPGYSDIPTLFQDILSGGLYSPETIHLGPSPFLPGQVPEPDDHFGSVALGTGVDTLSGKPTSSPAPIQVPDDFITSQIVATGGASWQLFDSRDAVETGISTALKSSINTSANCLSIPEHLYELSGTPNTIYLVLQWSSDTVKRGLNVLAPANGKISKPYRTLIDLNKKNCTAVQEVAAAIIPKDLNADRPNERNALVPPIVGMLSSVRPGSLAAIRLQSWIDHINELYAKLDTINDTDDFQKSWKKEGIMRSIQEAVMRIMPYQDLGQECSEERPFQLTSQAQKHLNDDDLKNCYAAFGHRFVESYTERANMSAVWKVSLTKDTNVERFYALRLKLQKYFLSPRTVLEVCKYFSEPMGRHVDTTVTINGYRDEFTNKLEPLRDQAPATALKFLTQEALARNKSRTSLTVRPWNNIVVDWNSEGNVETKKGMLLSLIPIQPEEFFVLKSQKAAQLLLLLKLHSSDAKSGIEAVKLNQYLNNLNMVLRRDSLGDNGVMTAERKELLGRLVRKLEDDLAKVRGMKRYVPSE